MLLVWWTERLLEMTDAEGLSPKSTMGPLWIVAGEGRGLLYAKRAMSVKPARRRVRSAAIVSGNSDMIRGWMRPCALVFNIWGFVYQCTEG